MAHDTGSYVIDFFKNADESKNGTFNSLKNTMDILQLDWKTVSSFTADNANCNFGANHSLYTVLMFAH